MKQLKVFITMQLFKEFSKGANISFETIHAQNDSIYHICIKISDSDIYNLSNAQTSTMVLANQNVQTLTKLIHALRRPTALLTICQLFICDMSQGLAIISSPAANQCHAPEEYEFSHLILRMTITLFMRSQCVCGINVIQQQGKYRMNHYSEPAPQPRTPHKRDSQTMVEYQSA